MESMPEKLAYATLDPICRVTEKTIGDKQYIVKSVFIGERDVKTALLKLAEQRAIREMGLDTSFQ